MAGSLAIWAVTALAAEPLIRFVAGEDTLQDTTGHPGWGILELSGTTLGTLSIHEVGSARMGNDPKTSVLNKWQQAHDVPNLFIVDGSNLVTGGRNHPTLTIQALAFRATEHIIRDAKDRTLRSKA